MGGWTDGPMRMLKVGGVEDLARTLHSFIRAFSLSSGMRVLAAAFAAFCTLASNSYLR